MTADAPLQQRFGLTVTPQNVLGVRAVVLQEAHDLFEMLRSEREQVVLTQLGGDPVSLDMSGAFNPVTDQLIQRAQRHIDSLKELGEELADTARGYGHTEADISASFGPRSLRSMASQVSPNLLQATGMGAATSKPSAQRLSDVMTGGLA